MHRYARPSDCAPASPPCGLHSEFFPLDLSVGRGTASGTWPLANADYANTRDAVGSLISSHNVNQLCIAWSFPINGVSVSGALATAPIVVNGTVYLQDLQSNVYAIDLQTGTLKWKHQYHAVILVPMGWR